MLLYSAKYGFFQTEFQELFLVIHNHVMNDLVFVYKLVTGAYALEVHRIVPNMDDIESRNETVQVCYLSTI